MNPTHEVYFEADNDIVGTAVFLDNGDISISLNNGTFAGIFKDFSNWNPGGYALREIKDSWPNPNAIDIDFEIDFDDNWLDDLDQQRLMDNSPANPSWSFDGDTDTDIYHDGDNYVVSNNIGDDTCNLQSNEIVFYTNGKEKFRI